MYRYFIQHIIFFYNVQYQLILGVQLGIGGTDFYFFLLFIDFKRWKIRVIVDFCSI